MNLYTKQIIGELTALMETVETDRSMVTEITQAAHIFVKGCGRTGLVMNMYAMRLAQIGLKTFVIGEATTPKAGPDDLLILGSGSGETKSLTAIAEQAKTAGMKIILFTARERGTLQTICNQMVVIKAPGKYDVKEAALSAQPMGALFEQGLLLYLESIVLEQMKMLGITESSMQALHANLE